MSEHGGKLGREGQDRKAESRCANCRQQLYGFAQEPLYGHRASHAHEYMRTSTIGMRSQKRGGRGVEAVEKERAHTHATRHKTGEQNACRIPRLEESAWASITHARTHKWTKIGGKLRQDIRSGSSRFRIQDVVWG